MVGADGTVLYYSPVYGNWYTIASGVSEDLYAVQDMGDGTAWIGGKFGRLLHVTQSGLSFADLGRVAPDNIRGVYFLSSSTGWIVGEKGTFKKTVNGGATWTSVSVSGLVLQDLFDIKASGDHIVIVGDEVIIDSQDGGASWSVTDFTASNITFNAAAFDSAGELWAAGSNFDVKSSVYHYETPAPASEPATPSSEETTPEAVSGNLIKLKCVGETSANDPCRAVYFYASDLKRHAFPNDKVFFTWFDNFDDVVEVSAEFMSDLSLGRNVTYHPGTRMVKFQSVRTVYGVTAKGVLLAVASESVASDLYGANWNSQIDDISDAFFGNYSFGDSINAAGDYDVEAQRNSVGNLDDNF